MSIPEFVTALFEGGRPAPTRPDPGPRDPERVGFDAVPRTIREDPRVSATAYRVYAAVLSCCWGKARETQATNAKLGERAGDCSPDTIGRALANLERCGYLKRVVDPLVLAGRRIVLLDPPPERPG